MALAVASSTTRVSTSGTSGKSATSGSFNAPANSVLVAITHANSPQTGSVTCAVTNNGAALSWTQAAIANLGNAGQPGGTFIHVAPCSTARNGITVTATTTNNNTGSDQYTSIRVWVVTGANLSAPIGGSRIGGSTTNNLTTTSFAAQGNNSIGFGAGTEWNGLGTPTSSDIGTNGDGFNVSTTLSGFSGWKQLGATGSSVTFNLDAGNTTAAKWVWAAVEIKGLSDPPTVDAGGDVQVDQYGTVTVTATENDNGSPITNRAWTVVSGPNQVGATLGTTATLSWKPTVGGDYVIRYTATNDIASASDDISVSVNPLVFPITARLALRVNAVGKKSISGSRTASLELNANRTGAKRISANRTASIELNASIVGMRINVATATIALSAAVINVGRPGKASVTAALRLRASVINRSHTTTGVETTGTIELNAHSTAKPHRFGNSVGSTPILLEADSIGSKTIPARGVIGDVALSSTIGNLFKTVTDRSTATIALDGEGINPSRVTFNVPVSAILVIRATPQTSSVRFNRSVAAFLGLAGRSFGHRIIAEITTAVLPRADNTTQYELVCVARIPQTTGPPILIEVDPIDWTSIDHIDELNVPSSLSVAAKLSSLTDPVLQRVRDIANLPTELWLYRNGKQVFAGPLLGWNVSEESLSLEAQGLEAYFKMMYVTGDLVLKDYDQFDIVTSLIDQWQTLDYGNFGIDTSDMPASGVIRTITYKRAELHNVAQRIDDLTKMSNGFDLSVDPTNRRLQLHYPMRGVDRSFGEDSVVFDQVNVTSTNIVCSGAPGDLASEALGTGTATGSDEPFISEKENVELRARYGRAGITGTFSNITDQSTLDSYVQAMIDARGQTLMVPGPNARVTVDSDVSRYDVGDTVDYQLHSQLSVSGAFRIRKRSISVSETGTESVTLEFV